MSKTCPECKGATTIEYSRQSLGKPFYEEWSCETCAGWGFILEESEIKKLEEEDIDIVYGVPI